MAAGGRRLHADFYCQSTYTVSNNVYKLAHVNNASYRTMVIMSIYTALSSIWFIGSFLLLVSGVKGKHMKPVTGKHLHFPWTIVMILVLLLDAIAAILYSIDLLATKDFSELMGLLNIQSDGSVKELDNRQSPPIIMALLTSKGVLFWIVNIAVVAYMQKQFRKLFCLRQQAEFVRAQLASMPDYMLPPNLLKIQQSGKDARAAVDPPPTLPRLTNRDGQWVGEKHSPASERGRSSALQMAARQGFSYERPPDAPGVPDALRLPRLTSPHKYAYGGSFPQDVTDNWHTRPGSLAGRADTERSSNILQKDNDVFY